MFRIYIFTAPYQKRQPQRGGRGGGTLSLKTFRLGMAKGKAPSPTGYILTLKMPITAQKSHQELVHGTLAKHPGGTCATGNLVKNWYCTPNYR